MGSDLSYVLIIYCPSFVVLVNTASITREGRCSGPGWIVALVYR